MKKLKHSIDSFWKTKHGAYAAPTVVARSQTFSISADEEKNVNTILNSEKSVVTIIFMNMDNIMYLQFNKNAKQIPIRTVGPVLNRRCSRI